MRTLGLRRKTSSMMTKFKQWCQPSGWIFWKDVRKQYFHLAVRPWLLNSPGRSKRKGEEDSQNGGFCMMYSKQKFDNKGVSKDRKTVRNSFAIKHSYACQLRNIETGTQWLIIKTEEAPDSNDWQKRGDRWKNGRKTASRVKTYIAQTRNGLSSITS